MGDEQERQTVVAHQLVEQRDELPLHDSVERAGRLVGDQEGGVGGKRGRDGDALPLAAGEFVRIAVQARSRACGMRTRSRRSTARRAGGAQLVPRCTTTTSAI